MKDFGTIKYLFALSLIVVSATAWAIPAKRVKKTVTLSDGTQKELLLVGDENMHFYLDADNNAYTCDAEGIFRMDNRHKLESKWQERLAKRNQNRLLRAEKRGLNLSPKTLQEENFSFRRRAQWGAEQNPISGDKTGLVILVNFADKQMIAAHDNDFYNDFFNKVGFSESGNSGSVHDYFYECSYEQFNLTFDVYGPVTVSKGYAYYGQNVGDADRYPGIMVAEACALVDQMGVDFSKYDWDNDGFVDQVFLVYAGPGEHAGAPANTLWPHESSLSEEAQYGDGKGPVTYDGVTVDVYGIASELDDKTGDTPCGIGVACHEFSHCMAIPDFYDTKGTSYGMDSWDLMDYGSYSGPNGGCPAPYTSYERMYCGWLTPKLLSDPCKITEMKPLVQDREAYIIYNDANPNEYYMLENRQRSGFGAYDPAHGLLVLHVFFDSSAWIMNTVNNNASLQRMTIIPADNRLSSSTNDGDTWPGTTGKTELTDTSKPTAKLYEPNLDGSKLMGKSITEIAESRQGYISFVFNGGVPIDTPVASEASDVKADGFTARWDAVEGATSYKVMLTESDIKELPYSISDWALLQEDFSKFNNGTSADGKTDVSPMLDDYTNTPGWTGEKLYTTPQNELMMGNARIDGYIISPWMTTESKTVTFVFTARSYSETGALLQLGCGQGENNEIIGEIDLTTNPVRYVVSAEITDKLFRWSLQSFGRCYISEMSTYEGRLTEDQIEEGVVFMKKTKTSVVETEGTSYEFSNLSNQYEYTYSICALNGKGQSHWSDSIKVILPTDESSINEELRVKNEESANVVYDLSGRKITSQLSPFNCHLSTVTSHLKKGIYIINGKKVIR